MQFFVVSVVAVFFLFCFAMVELLEGEDGWSVSFAGCGFLGVYHIGVATCLQERVPRLLRDARCIYGASAGALAGAVLIGGGSLGGSDLRLVGKSRGKRVRLRDPGRKAPRMLG